MVCGGTKVALSIQQQVLYIISKTIQCRIPNVFFLVLTKVNCHHMLGPLHIPSFMKEILQHSGLHAIWRTNSRIACGLLVWNKGKKIQLIRMLFLLDRKKGATGVKMGPLHWEWSKVNFEVCLSFLSTLRIIRTMCFGTEGDKIQEIGELGIIFPFLLMPMDMTALED